LKKLFLKITLNEASVLCITLPPRCYFSSPVIFEGSALAFVIDNLCHEVVTRHNERNASWQTGGMVSVVEALRGDRCGGGGRSGFELVHTLGSARR